MRPLNLSEFGESQADANEIARAVGVLFDVESVVELRALPTPKGTVSGYFDGEHRTELGDSAAEWSGIAANVYFTLNPVSPDLLARCVNRVKPYAKHTTADGDIVRRVWLLLDFDSRRPAGISATDAELEAGLSVARECREWLRGLGWIDPIFAMSGNGAHLLYRVDLPNDKPAAELVKRVLTSVAAKCDSKSVTVDQSVYNAARICKLYGTLAAKGDDLPDRPHRIAKMLEVPERGEVVPRELLESLVASTRFVAQKPESMKRATLTVGAKVNGVDDGVFDLESWIINQSVPIVSVKDWQGGRLWDLVRCPWKPDHKDGGAWVAQLPDGTVLAGCHHASCEDKGWPDLRDVFEPGWREAPTAANEADDDPHRLAHVYLNQHCTHTDGLTLQYWRGLWHRWLKGAWRVVADEEIKAELVRTIKVEFDRLWVSAGAGSSRPTTAKKVTGHLVANTLMAVRSIALIPSTTDQPAWLNGDSDWKPTDMLAARNGLVHLPSLVVGADCVRPPTPNFFASTVLDYDVDTTAAPPTEWLAFLAKLWPNDSQSVEALQEFMGYFLVSDTRQQKILMLIGPKRSGKSTIAGVITKMVGASNVAGPTLASLTTTFGLWPLLGKSLAVIADARLSGRTDSAVVVERLLSISGEDSLTIDRKNLAHVTCKLPVRIVIISNEMPRFADASGALVGRLIVLALTRSWFGEEDTQLADRLLTELPGHPPLVS